MPAPSASSGHTSVVQPFLPVQPVKQGSTQVRSIRHILACLDRSELSEECLPYARFVADAFGAKITLLHVMPSAEGSEPPAPPDPLAWEIARREAEQYLGRIRSGLEGKGGPDERISMQVTQGRPAQRIVTLARDRDADLAVLASHGGGGVGEWNLGSTTQQVLALAPCSVLVVPAPVLTRVHLPPRRIMVPLDGSLRTECVLPPVAQMARLVGAELVLVHIVAEPAPTAVLSRQEDLELANALAARLESGAERYLSRLRQQLLPEITRVESLVLRRADERRSLLEAAEQRKVDLLVLAAHGRTANVGHPFGSVSGYLLAHTTLPLLVLQDLPLAEREGLRHSDEQPGVRSAHGPLGARSLEET